MNIILYTTCKFLTILILLQTPFASIWGEVEENFDFEMKKIKSLQDDFFSVLMNNLTEKQKEKSYTLILEKGLHNFGGERNSYIYSRKVEIEFNNSIPVSINFLYTQTIQKSLIIETREIINKDLRSNRFDSIKVIYDSTQSSRFEKIFSDFTDKENKRAILRRYRNNLLDSIQKISTNNLIRKNKEKIDTRRILFLGTED